MTNPKTEPKPETVTLTIEDAENLVLAGIVFAAEHVGASAEEIARAMDPRLRRHLVFCIIQASVEALQKFPSSEGTPEKGEDK